MRLERIILQFVQKNNQRKGSIMVGILAVLVALSACVGSGELDTAVDDSISWTYRPNSTSPCQCGSSLHGTIVCNLTTGVLRLQTCLCVTYNPITNESVAGHCPYSCIAHLREHIYRYELSIRRSNFTDLTLTCGVWKKEGPYSVQNTFQGMLHM